MKTPTMACVGCGMGIAASAIRGHNKRELNFLKKYWKKFYKEFTAYLYRDRNCFDNYVGHNIKQVRTFFNWINNDLAIHTGPYHKQFYICKEEIPIITLSKEQFKYLIYNDEFNSKLSLPLQRTKDLFVIGCTVGLRYSDLTRLKKQNIDARDGMTYLKTRSKKTSTDTMVKLPNFAISILGKYKRLKSGLLPAISLVRFNANLKKIGALAGWTYPIPKLRAVKGVNVEKKTEQVIRFCDALSSHTMRRTSITTMLTSGMPEQVVRKISGHTGDSKAFFRYVDLAQSLIDSEIDKMHTAFA